MTGNDRVLQKLTDGRWHTHHELYSLGVIVHSRISDLRKRGHEIECRRVSEFVPMTRGKRETTYEYRLVRTALEGDASRAAAASPSSATQPGMTSPQTAALEPTSEGRHDGSTSVERLQGTGLPSDVLTLDRVLDQAIRRVNAEFPGMLVEVAKPLPIEAQRVELKNLQRTIWGEAA